MTGISRHLGNSLANLYYLLDVLQLQLWVNALGEHVVSNGKNVHVTCALAVAKEGSLHSVSAGQKTQLCNGNSGSTVIVWVDREDNIVSVLEMGGHPLNLVSIDIRSIHLHCSWQVENNRCICGMVPGILHCGTYLKSIVNLSSCEGLW